MSKITCTCNLDRYLSDIRNMHIVKLISTDLHISLELNIRLQVTQILVCKINKLWQTGRRLNLRSE